MSTFDKKNNCEHTQKSSGAVCLFYGVLIDCVSLLVHFVVALLWFYGFCYLVRYVLVDFFFDVSIICDNDSQVNFVLVPN